MSMQFGSATEFSNKCGVTLMNTPIGRVVADVMGAKDGVELTEYPSMIRVDGVRLLEFDYDELTEAVAWKPGPRIQIVLIDRTDSANGFATAIPYPALTIYVTAPSA